MSKSYKLHLQVRNGNLRLIPKGPMSSPAVEQLLRVARSALTFFAVLTVDLRGALEIQEAYLEMLEGGLQQLIAEKKLVLTCEVPKCRWVVHQPTANRSSCKCGGLCQDCPHGSHDSAGGHQKTRKASG
jgi:hypothetical protein